MSEMVAKPSAHAERTVSFLQPNGSEVPFRVFRSQEVYDREQERIFRGATWSFLGLEAEIPNVYDFKITFLGATTVVVTRTPAGLDSRVHRCPPRGAQVSPTLR